MGCYFKSLKPPSYQKCCNLRPKEDNSLNDNHLSFSSYHCLFQTFKSQKERPEYAGTCSILTQCVFMRIYKRSSSITLYSTCKSTHLHSAFQQHPQLARACPSRAICSSLTCQILFTLCLTLYYSSFFVFLPLLSLSYHRYFSFFVISDRKPESHDHCIFYSSFTLF